MSALTVFIVEIPCYFSVFVVLFLIFFSLFCFLLFFLSSFILILCSHCLKWNVNWPTNIPQFLLTSNSLEYYRLQMSQSFSWLLDIQTCWVLIIVFCHFQKYVIINSMLSSISSYYNCRDKYKLTTCDVYFAFV